MDRRYQTLLSLPRPQSVRHPPMSCAERACQFAPFAALTGYEEAAQEAARLTDTPREVGEDEAVLLDRQLRRIQAQLSAGIFPQIQVTYFVPDRLKSGGAYVKLSGPVRRLEPAARILIFQDGRIVPIDRITQIRLN